LQTSAPSTVVHHERWSSGLALATAASTSAHGVDLVAAEHTAQVDEAGPAHEVDDGLVRVVERERRGEVERPAVAVDHRRRVGEVVDGLAVERRPQGRLPAGELPEAADRHLDPLGIEEGEACLDLPDEPAPVPMRQLDDGLGVVVAGRDLDAVGRGRVRVRPPVVEAEGDGPAALQVGGRQLSIPRRQPLRKLDRVERVEVDGTEALTHR
jgi:hypothetical protein